MKILKNNNTIIDQTFGLVYIIILTYNGKKWIDNCIDSVLKTNYRNYGILVVDNASKDGTVEYIKEKYPQIKLIENYKNCGFAEGNNIGIKYALIQGADYVVLLNQDTIVTPDWILELVLAAGSDRNIGVLGPIQYNYEGKDIDDNFLLLLNTNGKFSKDYNGGSFDKLYAVDRVIGSAMLITREVLENVGCLDPLYFCYWEEADLCRRVVFNGYKIFIVTTSKILHWHARLQSPSAKSVKYIYLRNHFLYFFKDPNKIFIKNIYAYFKWGFRAIISSEPDKNLGYISKIFWIQFWILFHLPYIIINQYNDRKNRSRIKTYEN